jgi:hypothetical protein
MIGRTPGLAGLIRCKLYQISVIRPGTHRMIRGRVESIIGAQRIGRKTPVKESGGGRYILFGRSVTGCTKIARLPFLRVGRGTLRRARSAPLRA